MAIKFEKKDGDGKPVKPDRKEVGGKAPVAEEPSADEPATNTPWELPFGKPMKPVTKGRRR